MNMPGFTAEASIYKAKRRYQLVASDFFLPSTIEPQQVSQGCSRACLICTWSREQLEWACRMCDRCLGEG